MKKFVSGVLIGCILIFCVGVLAQNKEIVIEKLPLKYIFNGVEKMPAEGEEGFIYNDRTYVPIRFVSEALDKSVEWNEETHTISISDKKEMEIFEYKWYDRILEDLDVTDNECTMDIIGNYEKYSIVEVSVCKGDDKDWYVALYRCETSGEEIKLIANTQSYLGGFNYAVCDEFCIYNGLDENNNKYLEVKDIATLEVTATLSNTYDEYIYEGSILCMKEENNNSVFCSISPHNGFIHKIKDFPESADLKIFEQGKYLHIICTDPENEKIYYYEIW